MSSQTEKRITVKFKHPNPLFEEWLTTWRDQAAAKGNSKMQYSFNQALKSLRSYPLPLGSGRECKILKGFGNKLCKMLDDKLIEHQKIYENITSHPIKEVLPPDNIVDKLAERALGSGIKENKNVVATQSSKKKCSSSKQYIPQYKSGGYAILLTLYKQSLQPGYAGYLKKTEIIQQGKSLLNSSFTKPDPGSRYTAWNSMRTLLARNLVTKVSHPPKYCLTEEGCILAKQLYENYLDGKDDNNMPVFISQYGCRREKSQILEYNGNFSQKHDIINNSEENICEFLDSPKVPENGIFSAHSKKGNTLVSGKNNINEEVIFIDEKIENSSKIHNKIIFEKCNSSSSVESNLIRQKTTNKLQKYYSTNTITSASSTNRVLKADSKTTLKKYTSSNSVTSVKSTVSIFESFTMSPFSFDIILYIDTNETSGSSNSEDDDILIGLRSSGTKFEVKNLKIGDFTWICRDRVSNQELILPYIIERKRMDDFAHSIRDKRYHEQKFRLKKSGIENLTYLVESHGRNQHLGLPIQTLYQAATNTAIQENFFIKFTENTKETIDYLVNFSTILVKMFKSKTLASCAKNDLQPIDINKDIISLMTFKEFNESSVKNKRMKVTDLFVKMLIQIKGMSVERALAVTQKYPTPLLLKKAYITNPENISEKLLSTIKFGTNGKNLGVVLSKTVYQVFSKTHY